MQQNVYQAQIKFFRKFSNYIRTPLKYLNLFAKVEKKQFYFIMPQNEAQIYNEE